MLRFAELLAISRNFVVIRCIKTSQISHFLYIYLREGTHILSPLISLLHIIVACALPGNVLRSFYGPIHFRLLEKGRGFVFYSSSILGR